MKPLRIKKLLLFCLICFMYFNIIIISTSADDINADAGTVSAVFLKINPSAKSAGKSSADIVYGTGIDCIFNNPAGIIENDKNEITFGHTEWFQSIKFENIVFGYPIKKNLKLAIGYYGLFQGNDLERRSGLYENIPEEPLTTSEGKFGGNDQTILLSISGSRKDKIFYGFTVKGIQQTIDTYIGYGLGFDFGLKYRLKYFNTGMVIKNFGQGIKFEKTRYNLPTSMNINLGKKLLENILSLEGGVILSFDTNYTWVLGLDIEPIKYFQLRSGVRQITGQELRATFGLTLSFINYSLDYSYEKFNEFGDTHRMNFSYKWNSKRLIEKNDRENIKKQEPEIENKMDINQKLKMESENIEISSSNLILQNPEIQKINTTTDTIKNTDLNISSESIKTNLIESTMTIIFEYKIEISSDLIYNNFREIEIASPTVRNDSIQNVTPSLPDDNTQNVISSTSLSNENISDVIARSGTTKQSPSEISEEILPVIDFIKQNTFSYIEIDINSSNEQKNEENINILKEEFSKYAEFDKINIVTKIDKNNNNPVIKIRVFK